MDLVQANDRSHSINIAANSNHGHESEETSEVDFVVSMDLLQALPRSGINRLFRLKSLEKLARDDVPADVDFYFQAELELTEYRLRMNELSRALEKTYGRHAASDVLVREHFSGVEYLT